MSIRSSPTALELDRTAALRASFLTGRGTAVQEMRTDLRQAWERSRQAGVQPGLRVVPKLLDPTDLKEYRASHEVFRAGEPALLAAGDLLEGTGCGIVLADTRGTVLHVGGDPGMLRVAERVGSLPGASWREDLVGNNALGTSLVTGAPVQFRFYEHWGEGWTDWFCAAVPIREPESQAILASLALVAHRQLPDSRVLALTTRLAGTLERQTRALRHGRVRELRMEATKLSRWFPDHLALAVDCQGALVWASGPVPGHLRRSVQAAAGSLRGMGRRGERELLLADRYPCLVIPLWNGSDHQGYLLVTTGSSRSTGPVRATGAGQGAGCSPCVVAGPGERRMVFTPDQVLAVRTLGGRLHVVTETGTWPAPYGSIREVQELLPGDSFFQVDRGCLVNLNRIREIHPMFNRTVTLVLADRRGTEIPVSRRRTAALRRFLRF